jgi:hypothetical protein
VAGDSVPSGYRLEIGAGRDPNGRLSQLGPGGGEDVFGFFAGR